MRPALLLCLVACYPRPFDVTAVGAPHSVNEPENEHHGYQHAFGSETPFLCRTEDREPVDCETLAAQLGDAFGNANYSCDSAGCHGSRTPGGPLETRSLHGSEGPSCWTCHEDEWN